jgi:hypothetical protein
MPYEVFVTTSDVSDYLGGIDDITAAEENLLQQMIDGVQSLFEAYVGYKLARDVYVEIFDGLEFDKLFPKNIPITEIHSIHESSDQTWDSTTLMPATEYTIAHNTYIQFFRRSFVAYPQNIRVSYTGGYTTDTLPPDIKLAIIEQVSYKFSHEYSGRNHGVSAKTEQDGIMSYMANKLLPGVVMVLNRYRKFNLA